MTRFPIAFSLLVMTSAAICAAEDAYTPLELYNGGWRVQKAGAAPDTLVNHCARTGFYYMCEQVVNGKTSALVVFVPADAAGKYHSTAVFPSGEARGPGDLTIDGSRWVYMGKSVEGDKTTWFRTTNVFTGKDHIHFEQGAIDRRNALDNRPVGGRGPRPRPVGLFTAAALRLIV